MFLNNPCSLQLPFLHLMNTMSSSSRCHTMGTVAVLSKAEFSGVGTAAAVFEFPATFECPPPGMIWPPAEPAVLAAAAAPLQTAEWLLSADLCLNPWPQDAHRKGTTSPAAAVPPGIWPWFPGICPGEVAACFFMCALSIALCVKVALHSGHTCGLTPVWVS